MILLAMEGCESEDALRYHYRQIRTTEPIEIQVEGPHRMQPMAKLLEPPILNFC
ncbi:hypothetical protein NIES2134_115750 [Thermostichus vulcanus NIES-2134]|nr:hypothetical protein NIES2134_115750 [Thermostichus vulcanus NIES-2134]